MAVRKKAAKTKRSTSSKKKTKAVAKKVAKKAAKSAKRAVPSPKKSAKPNPDLKKFKAALNADPKLQKKLLASKSGEEFHANTVKFAAKLGLHFTTAESKWHVAETRRLAQHAKPKGQKAVDTSTMDAPDGPPPFPYGSWGAWDVANQDAPNRQTAPPVAA